MLGAYQLVRVFAKPEKTRGNTAAIIFQQNTGEQVLQLAKESARVCTLKARISTTAGRAANMPCTISITLCRRTFILTIQ